MTCTIWLVGNRSLMYANDSAYRGVLSAQRVLPRDFAYSAWNESKNSAALSSQYDFGKPYRLSRSQLSLVSLAKSCKNRVSGPQLMFGCESSMRRSSVVPDR